MRLLEDDFLFGVTYPAYGECREPLYADRRRETSHLCLLDASDEDFSTANPPDFPEVPRDLARPRTSVHTAMRTVNSGFPKVPRDLRVRGLHYLPCRIPVKRHFHWGALVHDGTPPEGRLARKPPRYVQPTRVCWSREMEAALHSVSLCCRRADLLEGYGSAEHFDPL